MMGEIKEINSVKLNWFAGLALVSSMVFSSAISAATIDLTAANSSGSILGGDVLFFEYTAGAAGSGNVSDFVRYSSNQTTSQGYNTSGRPLEFDENNSATFTRDLQLSEAPIVNINGTDYREFAFDANENDNLITLTSIEMYTNASGGLNNFATISSGTSVFQYGSGDDIELGNQSSGSGALDMLMYVADSLFVNDPNAFVYLYSSVSGQSNGFEAWTVSTQGGITPIPVPAAVWLLGSGIIGLMALRRREKAELS